MFIRDDVVYFAFPKCGSDWVRRNFKMTEKVHNDYDENDWDACDINYCHVKPKTFINHHKLHSNTTTYTTVIRNTYDRLKSAYVFGMRCRFPYATDKTFTGFIDMIYENRYSFESMPMYWMYMPFENYFEGLEDKVEVYQLEDVAVFCKKYSDVTLNKRTNVTPDSLKDMYYYTDDMIDKVQQVYQYEIKRFGYISPMRVNAI